MKNYIKEFGKPVSVPKFAMGGSAPMGAPMGAPAPAGPAGGADPVALAQQALEAQDPNLAMEVCAMIVEMAGGGGAPAPAPEMAAAPMGRNGMAVPSFKKGGKMAFAKDGGKDFRGKGVTEPSAKGKKLSAKEKFAAAKKK